jgi:hypothetical protein
LARDPATPVRLNGHEHALIDVLNESAGASTAAVIKFLCQMRDHDLVPKVLEATSAGAEAKERLALVTSKEGVCRYVKASRNAEEALQPRANPMKKG